MTTIKKKVNIFKKLQKTKQKKFLQNKVPDNQEIGKKESPIFTRKAKIKNQAK